MLISYLGLQQSSHVFFEGLVVSDSGLPLSGAKAFFVPRLEEVVSSDTGEFKLGTRLDLPLLLIVSHDQYKSCSLTINEVNSKHIITLLRK